MARPRPFCVDMGKIDLTTKGRNGMNIVDRFWSRVRKTPTCWLWAGKLNAGYGAFYAAHKITFRAHRFAFMLLKGPIDPERVLDHICRVRNCVNPDHLRVVTVRENNLAGISPCATNARQSTCVRGHAFDKDNTHYSRRGWRICRPCRIAAIKAYREKKAKVAPSRIPTTTERALMAQIEQLTRERDAAILELGKQGRKR